MISLITRASDVIDRRDHRRRTALRRAVILPATTIIVITALRLKISQMLSDCSLRINFVVSFITIFGTLSFCVNNE